MDQPVTLGPTPGYFEAQQPDVAVRPSAWTQSEERLTREDSTTASNYLGAMWRQDSVTDGLIKSIIGAQMAPDPDYSPFKDEEWKTLTEGINPEYQQYFMRSRSPEHARYIRERLLEKQSDLQKLGDLGIAGNAARFAVGVLSPENLLTAGAGYLVSAGSRSMRLAKAVKGADNVTGAAAARAGVLAEEATARSASTASGILAGAGSNAAFEALRQSVNFENDDAAILEAALIGGAFTAPFAYAGSKQAARVADAAAREHSALKTFAKFEAGDDLTVSEMRLVDDVFKSQQVVKALDNGDLSPEEALKLLKERQNGPQLDDAGWLSRYGEDLTGRREQILDEMFPERVTRRTQAQFVDSQAPLQLGYEPAAGRSTGAPMQVAPDGTALPGVITQADLEARIRETAAKMFPKDPEAADRWAMEKRAAALGYKAEVATKVAAHKEAKKTAAAAPKSADEVLLGVKPEPTGKDTPSKAPKATQEPTSAAAGTNPLEAPKASPEAPAPVAPRFEPGKVVDFTARDGSEVSGVIDRIREDGWLMVETEDGKTIPLHPSRVIDANAATPEGFLKGTVGAAQAKPITDVSQQKTKFSKARLDIFATLNRSESENVRSLAFSLVKDPIQVDDQVAQAMTASEWKSQLKRTIGGIFHVESRMAAREAAQVMGIKPWQVPAFYHEFHSLVSRLTRGDLTVTHVNKDIAPMLQRASAAQREVYKRLLEEAKKVGVKGVENVEANDFYVNRVWNQKGIREAMQKHGKDQVYKLLATAINVPGFIGDTAKAARFLSAVQRLEFSKVMQNIHLYAEDMGTLRTELAKANLPAEDIDLVVDAMFTAKEADGKDAGRAANLKYRFDINETLSVNTPNGVLRISDLLENDSRVLVDQYLSSMGGHIALAKQGILSEADFQAKLKEVVDEAVDKGLNVDKDIRLLQDIYSNIVGRPMSTQDFSGTARLASALRGYTRAATLGQLGLTAAFEMKQAIGLMGFRAFMQQLPEFRGMIQAMRNGFIPDKQLARDMEIIGGWGTEMSSSYARAQEIDDGFLGQTLSRIEQVSNNASHAVDILSGNASFTSLTRQLSSMMATQRLADFATGRAELTPDLRKRLVGWGVDDDSIEVLMDSLKTYSKVADNGRVESIDWEKWSTEAPGTYEKFQTVNSRMVRDAIQDQDLGETMPFMHSTLGKVFGELKTFFLVAHAKNMLKNLSYADGTALQVFLIGYLGEILAYTSQVSMNYAHDPDKRSELLTPEAIALAAFARSPVAGMVPFFAETSYQVVTGGQSMFGQDSTANTGNRTLTPASLLTVQRLMSAPSTISGLLLNNGQATRAEALNAWKALPLNNLYGMRNLGQILTESLPRKEVPSD